jgi:CBS domain-containing protein
MKLSPELQEVGRRVRVLRDRVLIKPLPYVNAVLLTPGVNIQKGVVVSVGYGRRERRKVRFDRMEGHLSTGRSLYYEDGEELGRIAPMRVSVGDVVEFSPRSVFVIFEHDLLQAGLPDVGDLLMVWQAGIMTIDPDESLSDALMWQQPAGYDKDGNFMSGKEEWQRTQS